MYKEILTCPTQHNPESFTYLVHGILTKDDFNITKDEIEKIVAAIKNPNIFYRVALVGKLDDESARKLGYDGRISQIATYGMQGLIIEPPNDEVIQLAWNIDLGSPRGINFKKWVARHKGKIKRPLELLVDCSSNLPLANNELVLSGHHDTQVVGMFYTDTSPMKFFSERLRKIVSEIEDKEIPAIPFPDPLKVMPKLTASDLVAIRSQYEKSYRTFYQV